MKGGSSSTGTADSRGTTTTRGTATTKGSATTQSSQVGGSRADSASQGTSRGRGEGFVTEYRELPGPLWDLTEQIHVKSVYLAHLKVGHAVVRVANQRPCQVVLPYVGDQSVEPGRVLRARREILLTTPFVAPAAQVDLEYASPSTEAHRGIQAARTRRRYRRRRGRADLRSGGSVRRGGQATGYETGVEIEKDLIERSYAHVVGTSHSGRRGAGHYDAKPW